MYTLYLLRCDANNKEYIGQTRSFANRMRFHKGAFGRGLLHKAIKKYGWNCFEVIILHDNVPESEINKLEIDEIKRRNTLVPNGYNLHMGGRDSFYHHPNTIKKISESNKGRIGTMTGKKQTEYCKRVLSELYKDKRHGKDNPNYNQEIREQSDEICKYYLQGNSMRKTAKYFNTSRYFVDIILKELGIK